MASQWLSSLKETRSTGPECTNRSDGSEKPSTRWRSQRAGLRCPLLLVASHLPVGAERQAEDRVLPVPARRREPSDRRDPRAGPLHPYSRLQTMHHPG